MAGQRLKVSGDMGERKVFVVLRGATLQESLNPDRRKRTDPCGTRGGALAAQGPGALDLRGIWHLAG